MLKRVRGWAARCLASITFKVAIGPVVAGIVLAGVIAVSMAGLARSRDSLVVLHDTNGAAVVHGQAASTELLRLQASIFQLVMLLSMQGDAEEIGKLREAVTTSVAAMRKLSEADADMLPDGMLSGYEEKLAATMQLMQFSPTMAFGSVVELLHQLSTVRNHVAGKLSERNAAADGLYSAKLRDANQLRIRFVAAAALLATVLILVVILASRALIKPLAALTATMAALAIRDPAALACAIPQRLRGDQIGDMARALEVFRNNIIEADRLAAKDAEARVAKERRAALLNELIDGFNACMGDLVGGLSQSAGTLEGTAGAMSRTATQTTQKAESVAIAADRAGAAAQTVAAAAEQLSASVTEISRQVERSAQATGNAASQARQAVGIVRNLSDLASRIGQIIELINKISAQTRLLALNATIEAARAGEAGRGFAVVAAEVKNLAGQTANATDQIGAQIAAVQRATETTVAAIVDIGGRIEEASSIASSIAAAVEEQGAATAEIARNVQETADNAQKVSANIAGVTQAAAQTGDAVREVLGSAGTLSDSAMRITAEVTNFLDRVKAA